VGLAIGEEGVVKFISKQEGYEIEVLYTLSKIPNYVVFSKKAFGEPGAAALAEKFSKTLRQMKDDGAIQEIKAKYY